MPRHNQASRKRAKPTTYFQNEDGTYTVKRILDKHQFPDGSYKYLIHWEGYPRWESTWESNENLVHCREAVQEYEASIAQTAVPNLTSPPSTTAAAALLQPGRGQNESSGPSSNPGNTEVESEEGEEILGANSCSVFTSEDEDEEEEDEDGEEMRDFVQQGEYKNEADFQAQYEIEMLNAFRIHDLKLKHKTEIDLKTPSRGRDDEMVTTNVSIGKEFQSQKLPPPPPLILRSMLPPQLYRLTAAIPQPVSTALQTPPPPPLLPRSQFPPPLVRLEPRVLLRVLPGGATKSYELF